MTLDLFNADPTEVSQLREVIQRGDAKLEERQYQIEELPEIIAESQEIRIRMKYRWRLSPQRR